jgi:hypothetical protein
MPVFYQLETKDFWNAVNDEPNVIRYPCIVFSVAVGQGPMTCSPRHNALRPLSEWGWFCPFCTTCTILIKFYVSLAAFYFRCHDGVRFTLLLFATLSVAQLL